MHYLDVRHIDEHPGSGALRVRARRTCAAILVLLTLGLDVHALAAQSKPSPDGDQTAGSVTPGVYRWDVYLDGQYASEVSFTAGPIDSLSGVIHSSIEQQQDLGFYLARLDSFSIQSATSDEHVSVYVRRGPRHVVSGLDVQGVSAAVREEVASLFDTRVGDVLQEAELQSDIERVLSFYERRGHPFARAEIVDIGIKIAAPDTAGGAMPVGEVSPTGINVSVRIDEGDRVRLNDVLLIGATRTSVDFVEYLIDVERGEWLEKDLSDVHNTLESSQLFAEVSPVELIQVTEDQVIMVLKVLEEQPGAFDIVLGYQPPVAGRPNGLVGNGRLDLYNLFGGGRRIGLKLNRLPGQISNVSAGYMDPYFLRWPFRMELGFEGIQQDSTYGQQAYRGAIGYRLRGGLDVYLTVRREVTRPGQAGIDLVAGVQRIPRAEITFVGFSVVYSRLDRPQNPRRGLFVETRFERGRKRGAAFEIASTGDTTSVATVTRQERLEAAARLYVPLLKQQVLVLGNDARVLVSDVFDTSDLFRFGGTNSLRGYDEDRFRGRFVNRTLLEWRYLFERRSYAYLFFDLGYVDRPATADLVPEARFYPGYGFGMQFETGIGVLNTSLALGSSESLSQAKVHVGLSLGL